MGVHVGLKHVNITLQGVQHPKTPIFYAAIAHFAASLGQNWTTDIDFNEQFMWLDSNQMGNSFREAIMRGLPFPMLTVAEYFTIGQEGLSWGGQYRAAGYYAIIMLW